MEASDSARISALERKYAALDRQMKMHRHLQSDLTQTIDGSGATVYAGACTSAGAASTPFPANWTVSKTATGRYLITHNLGTTNYVVTATGTSTLICYIPTLSANSFNLSIVDTTNTFTDSSFYFQLAI